MSMNPYVRLEPMKTTHVCDQSSNSPTASRNAMGVSIWTAITRRTSLDMDELCT